MITPMRIATTDIDNCAVTDMKHSERLDQYFSDQSESRSSLRTPVFWAATAAALIVSAALPFSAYAAPMPPQGGAGGDSLYSINGDGGKGGAAGGDAGEDGKDGSSTNSHGGAGGSGGTAISPNGQAGSDGQFDPASMRGGGGGGGGGGYNGNGTGSVTIDVAVGDSLSGGNGGNGGHGGGASTLYLGG